MCGIAGVRLLDGGQLDADRTAPTLAAMAAALSHRGPDAEGFATVDGVGLAHTRLSIIDLAGSAQPMASPDGRWQLIFNGEIFNYAQLRRDLDWDFRTHGDTETLLAGLATRGIGFVDRLVGQFAFAAHDRHTGTTHLVRDRLGVLPLYWTVDGMRLVFGSEVKALLPALERVPGVDTASLGAYLSHRSVPSPFTLFEGIRKLQPAHRLEIGPDGRPRELRYWTPPEVESRHWRGRPELAVDDVDRAVTQAVRSALVADVPVGAYLSGGVDSSLIVAVMSKLREGEGVETFSAGFGDDRHDELPFARLVSDRLGTTHHEVAVRASDFEELWSKLTWHRDAPVSEPADVAVFRLAQAARERVKVVLSGEGGDELFAGYPKYRAAGLAQLAGVLPASPRRLLTDQVEQRLPADKSRLRTAVRAAGASDESERFRMWFSPFTAAERDRLLGDLPRRPAADLTAGGGRTVVDRMLRADLTAWLPDNLLERGDRMSMAASLELRPPLLDHRLVELAFRMPSSVKVRHGQTKWVLKEVARRYVPAEIVDRPKVGFRVPLDRWFRDGLKEAAWDRLTGPSSFVGSTLDGSEVRRILDAHDSGTSNEEMRIWTLLCLEVWHETFFRSKAPAVA